MMTSPGNKLQWIKVKNILIFKKLYRNNKDELILNFNLQYIFTCIVIKQFVNFVDFGMIIDVNVCCVNI